MVKKHDMNLIEYIVAIVVIALFLIGAVGLSVRLGRPNGIDRQPEERVQLADEGRVKDEDIPDDEIELGGSGDRPKRLLARLFGGDITRSI
jgi:hypothetical protein